MSFVFRKCRNLPVLPFYPRSCGMNVFAKGDAEDLCAVDFVEICWVNRGVCQFELNHVPVVVPAGECVYRLPGEIRRKLALGPDRTEVWWATFDGPGSESFMHGYGYPRTALNGGNCPEHLFKQIVRGLTSPRADDYAALTGVYAELLSLMVRREPETERANALAEECLYKINIRYEDADFNINTLADELGIHRASVNRAVQRETGIAPIEYLEQCRMERALELLRTTLLPISEIAFQCGFRRSNYFCRCFRRKMGLSPREYRERRPACSSQNSHTDPMTIK